MAAGAFRSASAAKAAAGSSSPSPPTPMRLPSGTRGGEARLAGTCPEEVQGQAGCHCMRTEGEAAVLAPGVAPQRVSLPRHVTASVGPSPRGSVAHPPSHAVKPFPPQPQPRSPAPIHVCGPAGLSHLASDGPLTVRLLSLQQPRPGGLTVQPVDGTHPEDGKFVTDEEEHCDPMHSFCGDPYYVYEAKCAPCHGTGSVRSAAGGRRGGRQSLVTCPHCHGVGVSRSVTTRFIPSEEHHGAMSLGRSVKAEKKQIGLAANPTAPRKAPSYFRRRSSSGDSSSGNGASANGNGASANGASAGDAKGSSNGNGAAASAANKDSAAGAADRKPSAAGI
eukprot:CAMPEP_0117658570 /NCGR_PEP_ID=MMETSP0804-20121206/5931_1 /TAXON_ID=1074897 /ORGANISM="Tetraselmis astigmatica, Strain CCMP880" /LENGTH=334 /DNA_ID=CAMNT_0005465093 /DNA_START=311 /DNA_END=1315 /DNA_ORIENTATION=-